MVIRRVAIIYDDSVRPETTGSYCRRALEQLAEVEHFPPADLHSIPQNRFDLYLNIDDGLRYRLPENLRPSAWWAIDTHMDFAWYATKGRDYDFVFVAQRDGASRLRAEGIAGVQWLPLACDPEIHRQHDVPKRFDVCFVGNVCPGARADLLRLIEKHYGNAFVGQRYFEEMAKTYSASRIVFNRSVKNDVNMRVFEALACGSLLLTNELGDNGQQELFHDGVHLATYREPEELLEKLAYYLKRADARERIAAAGRQEVLAKHTYRHRMERILDTLVTKQHGIQVASPRCAGRSSMTAPPSSRPSSTKVSACLVAWKRHGNIKRIVRELQSFDPIDDITVWNNDKDTPLAIDEPNVSVINNNHNMVTYGRFLATRYAKHDIIFTQDDDCLVHNIRELYESFLKKPNCIAHGLKPLHMCRTDERVFGNAQMALLGWGAFFNRHWVDVFREYIDVYGEDELLLSKADRIFSILLARPHQAIPACVTDLPGHSGAEAMYLSPEHRKLVAKAIGRALALIASPTQSASTREQPPRRGREEACRLSADAWREPRTTRKDPMYFECSRPEVAAMIPGSTRHVLDIGCGAGALGAAIKARQPVEVVGIELAEQAAKAARHRLDEVIVGDVETPDLDFPRGSFDCIVCADLLEHLRDPASVLRRARRWLADEGCLVASIPNVRHHSVVTSLLEGNWTYQSSGLLDDAHLHFFTCRDIEALFRSSGYEILRIERISDPGLAPRQQGPHGDLTLGDLTLCGLQKQEAEEFFVYQYLIVAVPTLEVEEDRARGTHQISLPSSNPSIRVVDAEPVRRAQKGIDRERKGPEASRKLSLLYVGDFRSPGKSEQYAATALRCLGHRVDTIHDADVPSVRHLVETADNGQYDCLLFYKGCLGAKTLEDRLHPTGEEIAQVIREIQIPCYTWYFDRACRYAFDPSRERWMRKVAPLCRVAFVADGALLRTDWARWHLLRQGVSRPAVHAVYVQEDEKEDIGFIGQIYGERLDEVRRVTARYEINVISAVFGADLNRVIRSHKIVLGPRFPSVPGYWSNRIYVVLGHGGFFLAPEIDGMREEGFIPGVHYAALGDDPAADIQYWLSRPDERERIAKAGQALVLSRFTYKHRVEELARVITETLSEESQRSRFNTGRRMPCKRSQNGSPTRASASNARVAVAVVNYNTARYVSHLLFSLFRVVGHDGLARVVVVDNGSADASRPLLRALQESGLIEVIFNPAQRYHGPALNQAIDYLLARARSTTGPDGGFDHVWVLDSDTVVLRRPAVGDALARMRQTRAGMLGQFQYDALPEGYAHPSSLLFDLDQTFLPGMKRFDGSGAPARELHLDLRRRGIPICDFPYRSGNYVLHIGRGTRRVVSAAHERQNRYYREGIGLSEARYHGNPNGARIQRRFLNMFRSEVPELTPERLTGACLRTDLLTLTLPGCAEVRQQR